MNEIKVEETKINWKIIAGFVAGVIGVLSLVILRLTKSRKED